MNTLTDIVNYEKINIWQKKKEKNENCDMRLVNLGKTHKVLFV